jgi:outer membrane immunogenic protein
MRKLVASAIGFALLSGTAMAADLPSRHAAPVYVPPAAPPIFTWTGLYIGGQVGYDFGNDKSLARASATSVGLASTSKSESGVIGGAHIGYNYATPSLPFMGNASRANAVFGIEGDVNGTSAGGSFGLGGINVTHNQNVQGSVRGRVGVAFDRLLIYGTGGAAFGGMKDNYVNGLNGLTDSFSHTRVGWTAGGGVEYALTNNWSIRAEYRRTDFGHYSDNLAGSTAGGVNVHQHDVENQVLAGVSYKFDMFATTAAKY